jgi:hypothetical protein
MLRTLAATLSGLLAAVLLPLSIASVWVDQVATDTDRYVETVAPLANDDEVKAAAVKVLEREALRLVSSRLPALPPGADTVIHLAVVRVVDSEAFRTAWRQANRTAHEQLLAVLEGRSSAVDESGRVTVDLGTVFMTVTDSLVAQGLVSAERLPEVRASFAVLDADQLGEARRAYRLLDALGSWLPVAWAVLVLLTLLLSRRRLAATSKLALASLVALGPLAMCLVVAEGILTEELPEPEVAQAVWDVVLASLWRAMEVSAVVLVVVAIVAGVLGRDRSEPRAYVEG